MERSWLMPAFAALCLVGAPASAEETTPPAPPGVPVTAAPAESNPTGPVPVHTAGTTLLAQATAPAPAAEAKEEAKAPKFTYGATADFYYASNFNSPWTHLNAIRAFDVKDQDGINLGLIDLYAQWARDPVGFRLDLAFGPTAQIFAAAEPSNANDFWEHIQQAFFSVNLNKKGTTYLDFGKWNSTVGAEVVEPRDNWLYSRGVLYNWAQPFFHMGGRVYHYLNDTDYVGFSIHRGYNAVGDPGHGPGFILYGSKVLKPQWTLTGNYFGGDETLAAGSPGTSYRSLFDVVANYNPGGKMAYTANLDYGQQSGSLWYGISLLSKYTLTPKSFLAARAEWLRDDNGALFGQSMDAYTLTAGYTYVFNKYFQTKAELRYDLNGGGPFFAGGAFPDARNSQSTFLVSTVLSY